MNQEFIADGCSFGNFMSWKLEATNQGPDPALGSALAGIESDGFLVVTGEYSL